VNANLRKPAQVEQVVIPQSIIRHDVPYVFPSTVDIDGLDTLPPSEIGLVMKTQR
jgi:hypothetical protein